jgi:Sec-independent protein secretion pathway component TatC
MARYFLSIQTERTPVGFIASTPVIIAQAHVFMQDSLAPEIESLRDRPAYMG